MFILSFISQKDVYEKAVSHRKYIWSNETQCQFKIYKISPIIDLQVQVANIWSVVKFFNKKKEKTEKILCKIGKIKSQYIK